MLNPNTLTQDLLDFIDELRTKFRYNIGLEQFITVQNLIMALTAQGRLPAKLADLQTFLAPVLCHSPKEQEDFAQHFEKWVRRFETIIEVKSQPSSLEIELKQISRGMTFWKWTWRIVFVLVLTLIPMELFKLDQDISQLQTPQITKPVDQTNLSKPGVVEPPTLSPQTSLSQNIWELKWSIGLTLSLPLFLFLTWWLWWQYQVRRFLARKTVSTQPDLQQFLVQGHKHQLFSSVPLQRVAQGLRKHFTLPTSHLDVKTTLAKTIQAGGWFTPVMGTVQTSPEYLVLIDRTTFRDHQAEFINTLVKRLEAEEVFITRYYFDADPRRCYPEQPQLPPLTLPELAGRYPQHRLLIFTDGQGFIHPITGELAGWLTQLSDWSQRTLFTLESPQQWGYREKLLEDEAGFLVLPSNEAGLTVLVEYINEQRNPDPPASDGSSPEVPFPEMLIDRPRRYLERHAPEAETVTELLAQVRQFLEEKGEEKEKGYDWFSACAVYPELRWQITLYLGEALQVLNEERLAKLARLPWFRYGYIPNWLREKLVKDLSLAQEKKIREALQVLLLTAVEGGKGEFRLEVAIPQSTVLSTLIQQVFSNLAKQAPKDGHLRDYIFVTFMANKIAVRIPKILHHLLDKKSATRLEVKTQENNFLLEGRIEIGSMYYNQPTKLLSSEWLKYSDYYPISLVKSGWLYIPTRGLNQPIAFFKIHLNENCTGYIHLLDVETKVHKIWFRTPKFSKEKKFCWHLSFNTQRTALWQFGIDKTFTSEEFSVLSNTLAYKIPNGLNLTDNDLGMGIKIGGQYKYHSLQVISSDWKKYPLFWIRRSWVKSGWLYVPSISDISHAVSFFKIRLLDNGNGYVYILDASEPYHTLWFETDRNFRREQQFCWSDSGISGTALWKFKWNYKVYASKLKQDAPY